MKSAPDQTRFSISFNNRVKELKDIFSSVSPHENNLHTFSEDIFSSFHLTCTNFENLSKYLLSRTNLSRKLPKNYVLKDYKEYIVHKNLLNVGTRLFYWEGKKEMKSYPFKEFNNGETLSWFTSYNKVKHNYKEYMEEANLENLITAISALYILGWIRYQQKIINPLAKTRFVAVEKDETLTEGSMFILLDDY